MFEDRLLTFLKSPQILCTNCPLANNASLLLVVTCTDYEHTCANGQCLPNIYKCDGNYDCQTSPIDDDYSDEEGCPGKKVNFYTRFFRMSENVQTA